ncbi:MAG TPA: helix-turn-helix domain-containing protein [Candidatus Acidoferrales bacterium]|nr:helix-turn-helix domain-containing protein [Candidatus Acidoferrales bacterium]
MTAVSSVKPAKTNSIWLTPALQAELEWLAGEGPPNVSRHARIVLGRAQGMSIRAVAARVGVHPNSVRNCLRRFESLGLRGLAHASAGKPKNIAFTDSVRDEIARLAMRSPVSAGEDYTQWSLRRLREYLLRRGIVQDISVEGLRQLLRGLPLPPAFWRRGARQAPPLSPEVQRALELLAQAPRADRSLRAQIVLANSQGLSEAEIAAALHVGRETVRRWLRRFRRSGILGLQSGGGPTVIGPHTRRMIVRTATSEPRRFGVDQPVWTFEALRTALVQGRIVRNISRKQLQRILEEARINLAEETAVVPPQRSDAVG